MHSIKHNSWQVLNSYMFRHRGANLRELFRTKEYKPNSLISVLHRPYWNDENIKIVKF
jgi:lambda repressor-like predicted transcriptional regulator